MRLRLLFWLLTLNMMFGVDILGYELYNQEGKLFESGEEIAAYNMYTVTNDVANFELLVLDEVSHQILKVYSSNSGSVEFMLPLTNQNVKLIVTDYNEAGMLDYNSREIKNFKVGDYGYPVIELLEYDTDFYDAKFTLEESSLVFTKEQNDALDVKYQFIDEEKSHDLKFLLEGKAKIAVTTGDILQFVETVSGKEYFYEIEILDNDYIVRKVSSFDLKQISVIDVIDWYGVLKFFGLLVSAICVRVLMRREKKLSKKLRRRRRRDAK